MTKKVYSSQKWTSFTKTNTQKETIQNIIKKMSQVNKYYSWNKVQMGFCYLYIDMMKNVNKEVKGILLLKIKGFMKMALYHKT